MKISKVQWRALKTIRGSRRTIASTARYVPGNTLASLRKRDWIYLAPFEGSDSDMPGQDFYALTTEGGTALRIGNELYQRKDNTPRGPRTPRPRKIKAAPNLGPGLRAAVDAGFGNLTKRHPARGVDTKAIADERIIDGIAEILQASFLAINPAASASMYSICKDVLARVRELNLLPYAMPIDGSVPACVDEDGRTAREIMTRRFADDGQMRITVTNSLGERNKMPPVCDVADRYAFARIALNGTEITVEQREDEISIRTREGGISVEPRASNQLIVKGREL